MAIGDRIKSARLAAGFSMRQLAERAGISHNAISKYEKGLDIPSSGVLLRLANALSIKIEYFFRENTVELSVPSYRKKASLTKKGEESILAQVKDWLERYLEVESLFPDEEVFTQFSLSEGAIDRYITSVEEAERVAQQLREFWQLGNDPIDNLTELLEEKGIKIGLIDGAMEFDACILEEKKLGPVIVIKKELPGDRHRFNLAHELGHAIIKIKEGINIDKERACHRFAGAFLVPAEAVRRELGNKRNTIDLLELHLLKHKYGLSMQGWIFRAKDLGIIPESEADRLFKLFRVKKWYNNEPGDQLPPEKPERLKRLVLRALSEGIISEPRAAELLGKSLQEFWQEVEEQHKWEKDKL
ncbi:transcriptional regulator [Moorella sp. E308F]|uniref:helix-turn-helix domain-containing protein n=1 Tax=unclassified Neomoorella TaxID=2676739 RepID=UPI0010FFBE88|nr:MULTISPECIES: XRE family transcriptional regulator [unclassified Moorella (in: firmicutes)]GEA15530.1 transcriptional regulator [Moorella sp. E308F]GEA19612.1 transcriptional regulator [Moorella sp. E306M]